MHSPTIAYLRGREAILGGYRLPSDPRRAAEVLARELGGDDFAVDWLLDALDWLKAAA